MSLLVEVLRVLEREGVPHALIGAAALAIHGVSRSTADTDLLCVDARVLRRETWAELEAQAVPLLILEGDVDDPLAGTVRLGDGSEIVDVVVGRDAWQRDVIEAAETVSLGEITVPVVRPSGLVLLKLYAGGPKDAWDIRALLEASDDAASVAVEVEQAVSRLPAEAKRLWSRLRAEPQG